MDCQGQLKFEVTVSGRDRHGPSREDLDSHKESCLILRRTVPTLGDQPQAPRLETGGIIGGGDIYVHSHVFFCYVFAVTVSF